jgi:protocatechuate 3,4-dioxygenase beta subunit
MRGRTPWILGSVLSLALAALGWLLLGDERRDDGAGPEGREEAADAARPEEIGRGERAGGLATGPARPRRPDVEEAPPAAAAFSKAEGVFGRVIDAKERPIEGATVLLFSYEPQAPQNVQDGKPIATATTTKDGEFLVGPAPTDAKLKVRADAPGYATAAQFLSARGSRVDLILYRGGALRLRVKDEAGGAVKGAEARYRGGPVATTVETDAAGEATLDGLPTGQATVRVQKAGYATFHLSDVVVEPGKTVERTCVLPPGTTLSGRVTDEKGERGVAGADVSVRPQSEAAAPASATATSGDDGRFTVAAAGGPGEWIQVFARKEGYVVGTTQVQIQANALPGGQEVTVRLARERSLAGRVDDAHGNPVAGATVLFPNQFQMPGGGAPEPSATGSDGRFVLALPPGATSGAQVFVAARAAGRGIGAVSVQIPQGEGRIPDVVIRLQGSGSVGGTVKAPGGAPAEGASVTLTVDWNQRSMRSVTGADATAANWMVLQAAQDARLATLSAATDASGTWRMPEVPAGTYHLAATWGLDREQAGEPVTVKAGASETVELTIGGGQPVEGRVVDSQGAGVAGVRLNAWDPGNRGGPGRLASAQSDSDGRFTLRGITGAGGWQVAAYAAGYAPQTVSNVRAGDRDVEIRLTTLGWIVGVVTADRQPYGRPFTVSATLADAAAGNLREATERSRRESGLGGGGRLPGAPSQEFNSADGQFTLRSVPAGTYRVNVTSRDGLVPVAPVEVTVIDGREAGPVEVRLARGASIAGVLADEVTREPVAGAWLGLQVRGSASGPGLTNATGATDAKGRFLLQGLAPGVYALTVRPPAGVYFDEEVRLAAGESAERELFVPRGGAIRVRAVDAAGAPVAEAHVTVTTANGTQVQPNYDALRREGRVDFSKPNAWGRIFQTDANGVNERWHVPPGRLEVAVRSKDGSLKPASEWIAVASDRTTDVNVVLLPGGEPADR